MLPNYCILPGVTGVCWWSVLVECQSVGASAVECLFCASPPSDCFSIIAISSLFAISKQYTDVFIVANFNRDCHSLGIDCFSCRLTVSACPQSVPHQPSASAAASAQPPTECIFCTQCTPLSHSPSPVSLVHLLTFSSYTFCFPGYIVLQWVHYVCIYFN